MPNLSPLFAALLVCAGFVGPVGRADAPPTFARDVAPILAQHCVECHHPAGVGPFSLRTYDEARRRSRQIAEVVASGFMPPWKPLPAHAPPLQGDRSLPADLIQTLVDWTAAGAPAGDLATFTPPPPPPSGWSLGEPDLIVTLPEPFLLPATSPDVFQNFAVRLPLQERRFVRALAFDPASARVIHHAVIAFDPTPHSRQLDEAAPGPGWASMDLGTAVNPNGHIIGWTPGQVPYEAHPGTAFELGPGTDLILQLHLLPSGKPEPVAPRIGLYFSDEPPTRSGFVVLLRENEIDIPAGATDHPVHESFILPVDAAVLSLYPHAHYLGKDLRITATLPDGTSQWLLHIPDWDFNWQSDYRYVEPLPLPAGTRIEMAYTFDNSAANPRNPRNPPVRVRGGWGSLDEMAEVAIQFLLADRADLPRMEEAQARYQIESGDQTAHAFYNLAVALDRQERFAEAAPVYESTLAMDPGHAAALNNLAALRSRAGDAAAAIRLYQRALDTDPDLTAARRNLAKLLPAAAARELLIAGVRRDPQDLPLRLALAETLLAAPDARAARAVLREGLAWHEADPRLHLQLGQASALVGDLPTATRHLQRCLDLPLVTDGSIDESETHRLQAAAAFALALLAQQQRDLAALQSHLARALALDPTHRDARLMSAGVALIVDDPAAAQNHLAALLRLPAPQRPDEADFLSVMPFPEGVHVLARALTATGQGDAARELLTRHAAEARAHARPDWAAAFDQTRSTLP